MKHFVNFFDQRLFLFISKDQSNVLKLTSKKFYMKLLFSCKRKILFNNIVMNVKRAIYLCIFSDLESVNVVIELESFKETSYTPILLPKVIRHTL